MWRRAPPARPPPERGARRQRVSRVGSADCARRADASSDPPGVRVEVSPRNRVRWSSRHPDVAHSPRPPLPRRPAVADPPHPDAAVGASRARPPAAPRRVVDREPRPASGAAASARTRRATEGASRAPHTALGDSARAHPPPRERRANPRRRRRFGRAGRAFTPIASLRSPTLSRRCSPPRCTPTLNLSARNHRRDW